MMLSGERHGMRLIFAFLASFGMSSCTKLVSTGCGQVKLWPPEAHGIELRIVGGRDAEKGMFPWVGFLAISSPKAVSCTVSLINPLTVITAAHCILKECHRDAYVVLGVVDIKDVTAKNTFRVRRFYHHKSFNAAKEDPDYDVALVELDRPVDFASFNGTVTTVCIPHRDSVKGTEFYQAGWGYNNLNAGEASSKLEYMTSVPHSCHEGSSVFCMEGRESKQTPYKGDSGGPAMMLVKGKYYLVGTLSKGNTNISLYVKMSKVINWICYHKEEDIVEPKCL